MSILLRDVAETPGRRKGAARRESCGGPGSPSSGVESGGAPCHRAVCSFGMVTRRCREGNREERGAVREREASAAGFGAADRRALAKASPVKEHRWPRTERRQERIAGVLARRQPDLTVVLENVHDPHNVSAVLRSCDGVGVLRVHTVYSEEERPDAFARTTSASAAKWMEVVHHDAIEACYDVLRRDGFRILATALEGDSLDLYETDLTAPTALVFGNEMRGISRAAGEGADGTLFIPMMGMVQSLNISVACAVTLYEALRQRRVAGAYDAPRLDAATLEGMETDWLNR